MTGRTIQLYRRRAHIVVWDDEWRVTHPAWPLYWSPSEESTFVNVRCVGDTRLWIRLRYLVGHWDWLCGHISGYKVIYGYEGPICRPKYIEVCKSWRVEPDTRAPYYVSERMPDYDPNAHS